jgi:hypothetical protein
VLNGEETEQQDIDDQGFAEGPRLAGADGLGHDDIADETDRVKGGNQKNDVGRDAMQKCDESRHDHSPTMYLRRGRSQQYAVV